LLVMSGSTHGYRTEPNGEIVLGFVEHGAMRVRRARQRFTFGAGDACAWDASAIHEGTAHRCESWDARVIVLEPPSIADQFRDLELAPRPIDIPHPVIGEPALSAQFISVHRLFEHASASRLARESALAEYVTALFAHVGYARPSSVSRIRALRDPALLRACELLVAHPTHNISLDELVHAARIPRFRLLRLFRAAFGAPPHRYQIGQRIKLARRLLERGTAPSQVAATTGFADQAHMHRHFVRTLGITPKQYADAFRARTFKTAE
jgi:AraC-like DNA-binding protein